MGQGFAGVVSAVGPEVNNVAVGDEVLGLLRAASWQVREHGSLVTEILTSVENIVPKLASVSFEVAGGLGVAAQTAMGALRCVDVQAGDVVVTQLAISRGASVIGIANPANADYLRSLGATPSGLW